MSTTMFIPMPEWQALLFLRDRKTAFDRWLSPEKAVILRSEEVVPQGDELYGFRRREHAVEYGKHVYPNGFAMVRFVLPKLFSSSLTVRRHFVSAVVPDSQWQLWKLDRAGLEEVRDSCMQENAEVMVDQIFGACLRLAGETCGLDEDCGHEHGE